jgi:hypothetical protein
MSDMCRIRQAEVTGPGISQQSQVKKAHNKAGAVKAVLQAQGKAQSSISV